MSDLTRLDERFAEINRLLQMLITQLAELQHCITATNEDSKSKGKSMTKDKHDVKDWSDADRRYGWEIGCEGWLTVGQAAERLGYSDTYVYQFLNDENRYKPGEKSYPLRASEIPGIRGRKVCARSVRAWQEQHQPAEV